jgi:capsular polysaccharide transport system ATP-binding protein
VTLVLDRVAKAYRRRGVRYEVLTNVSAVFEPGQSICILGAPKCGKSTLMRILAGEARPDVGRVTRGSRVSFLVGSNPGRMGALTVREAIAFVARLYGFRTREVVDFVIDFADLAEMARHQVGTLAREDSSRLAYTLAYALPFDIYLADETYIGGPAPFQDRCAALVAERRKTAGLIHATSRVRRAEALAERGAVLHNGELLLFPTLDEAVEVYETLHPLSRAPNLIPEPPADFDD